MPQRILHLYSYFLPGLWALVLSGLLIFNTLQWQLYSQTWTAIGVRFLIPGSLLLLLIAALRATVSTRLLVGNCLLAITVSLYASDVYLALRVKHDWRQAAAKDGREVDQRDKLTVIRDLRAKGVAADPIMRAREMLLPNEAGRLQPVLHLGDKPFLPLASVPGKVVVSCNETGQWQIYRSDRHGFNNPDWVWQAPAVSVAMVGDSFTHGSCVPADKNMAAELRRSEGDVVNVGVGGFGPLSELAALTEYVAPLKPPVVLWGFFEGNDLNNDLPSERKAPILLRYLNDPGFSQDLIHKDAQVSQLLQGYLDRRLSEAMARVDGPFENLVYYLSLNHLREAMGLGPVEIGFMGGALPEQLAFFARVLDEANRRVRSWGGRLYVVYLPESDRYLSSIGASQVRGHIYRGVLSIAHRLGLPLIDVAAAFSQQADAGKLYAYPGAHFSVLGYHLAAAIIRERLRKDGIAAIRDPGEAYSSR